MMKVYQWHLSDTDYDDLVDQGFDSLDARYEAYRSRYDEDFKVEKWFSEFTYVADVHTDDLESAFALMNLWNEPEKVTKRNGRCCSLSVGDVLRDETNRCFVVAGFGFREISVDGIAQPCR